MLPPKVVSDVAAGNAAMKRNRTQACGAVAQLDKNKRQAEAGGGGFPPNFKAGVIADDPFNPRVVRRPQIDLTAPPRS